MPHAPGAESPRPLPPAPVAALAAPAAAAAGLLPAPAPPPSLPKRPPPSPLPASPSAALAAPRPCCKVQPRAALRALTQRAEAPPAGLSSALLSLSAVLPAVPAAGGPVVRSDIAGMSLVRGGACAARASPPPMGAPAGGAPISHSAAPRKCFSRRHAEAVTPPTLSRYIFTTADGRTRRTIGGRRQLRPQAASPPARQARGGIATTNGGCSLGHLVSVVSATSGRTACAHRRVPRR